MRQAQRRWDGQSTDLSHPVKPNDTGLSVSVFLCYSNCLSSPSVSCTSPNFAIVLQLLLFFYDSTIVAKVTHFFFFKDHLTTHMALKKESKLAHTIVRMSDNFPFSVTTYLYYYFFLLIGTGKQECIWKCHNVSIFFYFRKYCI